MIDIFVKFMVLVFTAAVAENAIFSRSFVTRKMLFPSRKLETAVFTMAITTVIGISGVLCFFADYLMMGFTLSLYAKSVIYIIIIAGTHIWITNYVSKLTGRQYELVKNTVTLASFNVAVLGTVLICSMHRYSFIERIGYFIGTGIGVTMALMLIYVGRQNMTMSNVPKSFRGLPITLIYMGILSLAVYGLVGHQLPF